jgi:hypothetical protein
MRLLVGVCRPGFRFDQNAKLFNKENNNGISLSRHRSKIGTVASLHQLRPGQLPTGRNNYLCLVPYTNVRGLHLFSLPSRFCPLNSFDSSGVSAPDNEVNTVPELCLTPTCPEANMWTPLFLSFLVVLVFGKLGFRSEPKENRHKLGHVSFRRSLCLCLRGHISDQAMQLIVFRRQ